MRWWQRRLRRAILLRCGSAGISAGAGTLSCWAASLNVGRRRVDAGSALRPGVYI